MVKNVKVIETPESDHNALCMILHKNINWQNL